MQCVIVFDLDETLINSQHRTPRNPDGTVNLEHYRANHSPENVFKDTLLPLADVSREVFDCGQAYVIFCTARDMKGCDYDYLRENQLFAHKVMSRDTVKFPAHYTMRDADYKKAWLKPFRMLRQFSPKPWAMFDDEPQIVAKLPEIGIATYCAHSANRDIERTRQMLASLGALR